MKIPEIRRNEIALIVFENGRGSIVELAERFLISEETIRRDLSVLHERGLVVKVHGGAITPDRPNLGAIEKRRTSMAPEKKQIAKQALSLFNPGQSLMLDSGTSTEILAESLASRGPFTVITNSMEIAQKFWYGAKENTVIMLGGELRLDTDETLGEITLNQLNNFNVDHAILGAAGISATGQIMRFRLDEAMIARAMSKRSGRVTVLADHTKFSIAAPLNVCELNVVTNLVTNYPPPGNFQTLADQAGTNIILADKN